MACQWTPTACVWALDDEGPLMRELLKVETHAESRMTLPVLVGFFITDANS